MSSRLLVMAVAICMCVPLGSFPVYGDRGRREVTIYLNSLPDVKTPEASTTAISQGSTTATGYGDDRYTCEVDGIRQQGSLEQLAAYGSRNDVMWPGSIIQGSSLVSNQLAPIALQHGAERMVVTAFVPGGPDRVGADISEPNLQSVTDKMIELVFTNPGAHQPASMTYVAEDIYSEHQAATTIHANYSSLGADISTYLNNQDYSTQSHVVITFVQQYYVTAVVPPSDPSDFFARRVSLSAIKSQTSQLSGPNPAVYVDTITYGRIAYIFLSSSQTQRKLKAAVDASFNGFIGSGSLGGSQEQQDIMRESQKRIFVLGGDAGAGSILINRGIAGLADWIKTGGTFSRASPGAAIAFSTRYLRSDYRVAGAAFQTDYSKPSCVNTPEKIISVNRSYAIDDDKDRGNAHRFLVLLGNDLLAAESSSGDDIVWRSSPPNYNGPALSIKVPVSNCARLVFRTEQTGHDGKTTGRAWVTGVTDAGRRLALVDGEEFSLDDTASKDYTTNCRHFRAVDEFPELNTRPKKE